MYREKFVFTILLLHIGMIHLGESWKPIVGQQPLTNAFSLKQEHPVSKSKETPGDTKIFFGIDSQISGSFPNAIPDDVNIENNLSNKHLIPEDDLSNFNVMHYGYSLKNGQFLAANIYEKEDTCHAKKFAFNHDGVVYYIADLPALDQFAICFWTRFTNHSGDHVLLTYAAKNDPRAFQFWVANSHNSSFISMAIKGQQMYRLNYPLRTRQWHHICSSWNGKTGEWQVWVKAERIGRGFHNSLVGHKIPSNGELFSGGSSPTGKVAEGLHFEISFIQIYRVALSAGKAHRDHKHHHAHHFDHEGKELLITTKPPPKINRPQLMHRLLANGQIPSPVRINLANKIVGLSIPTPASFFGDKIISNEGHIPIQTSFVNGQINTGSRLIAQQFVGLTSNAPHVEAQTKILAQNLDFARGSGSPKFVDETETHIHFKRQADSEKVMNDEKKTISKREFLVLNDSSNKDYFDGLANFGDQQFRSELSGSKNVEDEITNHDREPAEEEVKAVMFLCSPCEIEPFQGAIVFAWKKVQEKMDNALKGYTMGSCGKF